MGDPILVGQKDFLYTYQTRISKSEHVEGDPLFDCAIYTKSNSFDKCVQKEIKELFTKELGCQPPYLSENFNNKCNKMFNVSVNRSDEIFSLFLNLFFKDVKFKCKTPCTKIKYTTRSLTLPYSSKALDIKFDKTVDITRARFSIDGPTFLTKSGGFIGVGRTLLWILASLLCAAQVTKTTFLQLPGDFLQLPGDVFIIAR